MRKRSQMVFWVLLGGLIVGCLHSRQPATDQVALVGKTAPEVEGLDADSLPLDLGGLRGNIVLLDFWQSF
jgi:hypothetical protein